jgi:hypothetical protein
MLVLQSCTDYLDILPGSSCETFPKSSDGTYDVSNVKDEEDVKAEKVIGNEEDKEGIYSEEEEEEGDIGTKEDEDVNIKEEVSCEDKV